jgi:anaerobic selenocysteine-containing dehydrogenase
VIKVLIERGWIDRDFVARTRPASTRSPPTSPRSSARPRAQAGLRARQHGGVRRTDPRRAHAVLVWSMGITQHASGGEAVQMIVNLGLLRGYVGRERCG